VDPNKTFIDIENIKSAFDRVAKLPPAKKAPAKKATTISTLAGPSQPPVEPPQQVIEQLQPEPSSNS